MDALRLPRQDSSDFYDYLLSSDEFHAQLQYKYSDTLELSTTFLAHSLQSLCHVTWNFDEGHSTLNAPPRLVEDTRYQGVVLSVDFPCDTLTIHGINVSNHPFIIGPTHEASMAAQEKLNSFAASQHISLKTLFFIESVQKNPLISVEKRLLSEDVRSMLLIAPVQKDADEAKSDIEILPHGGNESLSFVLRSKSKSKLTLAFQWNLMALPSKQKISSVFSQNNTKSYTLSHSITDFLYVDTLFHTGSPYRTHIEFTDLVLFLSLNASVLSESVLLSTLNMLLQSLSKEGILPSQFFKHNEASVWRVIRGGIRDQKAELFTKAIHYFGNGLQMFLFPLVVLDLIARIPTIQSLFPFDKPSVSSGSHSVLRTLNAAMRIVFTVATQAFPRSLLKHNQYDPTLIEDASYSSLLNVHIVPVLLEQLDSWYLRIAETPIYTELAHFCTTNRMENIAEIISSRGTRAAIDDWTNSTQHFEIAILNETIKEHVQRFFATSQLSIDEKKFFQTQTLNNMSFTQIIQEQIDFGKSIHFYAKSLSEQKNLIPIMTANFCFNLYFSKVQLTELDHYCTLMELPYPLGLRTPIGIVAETVCYVSNTSLIAKETSSGGTARSLYVWQQCMILHGLHRLCTGLQLRPGALLTRMDRIYTWLRETIVSLPLTCNSYTFTCTGSELQALGTEQHFGDTISLLYGSLASVQALPSRLV